MKITGPFLGGGGRRSDFYSTLIELQLKYQCKIIWKYIPTEENVIADKLSRVDIQVIKVWKGFPTRYLGLVKVYSHNPPRGFLINHRRRIG